MSRAALLELYTPSLLPDFLAAPLKDAVATRDSLGPVTWDPVNWTELWSRCVRKAATLLLTRSRAASPR